MAEDDSEVEDDTVMPEDVAYFNRETMRDLAMRGRIAGTAVMIVAAVGALAWLWITVRTQQHLRSRGFPLGGASTGLRIALPERLDAAVATFALLTSAALAFVFGAGLVLLSSHLTVVYGGTLTGLEAGDKIPADDPEAMGAD